VFRLCGPLAARVPDWGPGAGAAQQEELRQLHRLPGPPRDQVGTAGRVEPAFFFH
jgi:hypothetical protein